ncbi:hypothetical protein HMPREF1869_00567 [Bacteroidales bacterium KA00251]|nr:hypothetical protein HMPREF1869_00567 [Bacteroidales bacterium KA00251]
MKSLLSLGEGKQSPYILPIATVQSLYTKIAISMKNRHSMMVLELEVIDVI